MKRHKERPYNSSVREEQAYETRERILGAAQTLFRSRGFVKTTIASIAKRARVAQPTIYAAFKSKRGLLAAVIDRATFGPAYDDLVSHADSVHGPSQRLRAVARIARFVHEATSAELDTIITVGDQPEIVEFEAQREQRRFKLQRGIVEAIAAKKCLRKGLRANAAHDTLWVLTGRDIFRLLTRVRGWSGDDYQDWLGDALCALLLKAESR